MVAAVPPNALRLHSNQGFGDFGSLADELRAQLHQGRLDAGLQPIDDVCKIETAGTENLDVLQTDRITELGLLALADVRGGGAPCHSLAAGGIGQAEDINPDGAAGHPQQPPPAPGPQPEPGDRWRPACVSTFRGVKTCETFGLPQVGHVMSSPRSFSAIVARISNPVPHSSHLYS
jgi:hypothetical protein